ncbi:hypothetical protein FXO38_09275 [Capsicum annuum]|nr:hypothetical protein FXO38_09275 [Capsicum annuum]KAF3668610.1 hypothetical protein FXO37_09454 [Capsicum annuum]
MASSLSSSSSRGRSNSPFHYHKPSTPYSSSSSSSSSSSIMNNGRMLPRSYSSSMTSFYGSGNSYNSRSMTPSHSRSDSVYSQGYENRTPVSYPSEEEMIDEPPEMSRSGDSISVTVRFRPMSEREYQKGDEIAWYADGGKTVRNEYNPATAYAFGTILDSFGFHFDSDSACHRVFGPQTSTQDVYEVAAQPVVKAAMEGIHGTVFAYGVTSSGKTHTMHGDHSSPGIIPLAIKDVFSIIQDVINDLLDPTGQNLRVREDAQVFVLLRLAF